MLRSPFRRSKGRPEGRTAQDFYVDLDAPNIEGAAPAFDRLQNALFKNWKARIHGSLHRGRTGSKAAVSVEFKPDYPDGRKDSARFNETVPLPVSRKKGGGSSALDRAEFDILIFKPEGRQAGGLSVGEVRDLSSGVRKRVGVRCGLPASVLRLVGGIHRSGLARHCCRPRPPHHRFRASSGTIGSPYPLSAGPPRAGSDIRRGRDRHKPRTSGRGEALGSSR